MRLCAIAPLTISDSMANMLSILCFILIVFLVLIYSLLRQPVRIVFCSQTLGGIIYYAIYLIIALIVRPVGVDIYIV